MVYITSTVPWINEQNGRVVPPLALPDVDWEKPGGVDPTKGYHSGVHAVVAVSRGEEETQGEGGIGLAFFGPLKQFVKINRAAGRLADWRDDYCGMIESKPNQGRTPAE